jgi:hypothetical protein
VQSHTCKRPRKELNKLLLAHNPINKLLHEASSKLFLAHSRIKRPQLWLRLLGHKGLIPADCRLADI